MDASTVLPTEIWLEALSYCNKADLKSIRLAGEKHLGTLAASQLFKTAYVAARRGVLDIFMQLTIHPVYRHYVREVVYDSSWIDPPTGGGSQTRSRRVRQNNSYEDPRLDALFGEQERIQFQEMPSKLSTAFAALSRVRRVVFADLSRTAGLPGDTVDQEGMPLIHRLSSGARTKEIGACCLRPKNALVRTTRSRFLRDLCFLLILRVANNAFPYSKKRPTCLVTAQTIPKASCSQFMKSLPRFCYCSFNTQNSLITTSSTC